MPNSRLSIWTVMIAGAIILMIVGGIRHSFGLYLPLISAEYGWGREIFSLGFAVQMFLLGFLGPFWGAVADRFGSGRVLVAGALLHTAGLLLMAWSSSPAGFVFSTGVMVGFGASATSSVIMIGAVGRAVEEKWLSRSVGVLMAGSSLGQILMLPAGYFLINTLGWSRALVVMAGLVLIVLPLASLLVLAGKGHKAKAAPQKVSHALRDAGRHSGYLWLNAGFFVCGFHVFFLAVHLPAYALDLKLEPVVGANALMLIGLFNMLGSNAWGYLGDRYSKKRLLGLIYLLRSVVIAIFLLAPTSSLAVYIFSSVIGFLWLGTVPLTSGLVGRIFGVRYLSMLYGIVFMSHQVGGFLGAWMAGRLFDLTGSYDVMWGLAIGLGVAAALAHLPIDDRPVAREPQREPPAEQFV